MLDGETIKRLRRRRLLTQHDLARESKLGFATVQRLEAGQVDYPRPATIRRLADALNVAPEELFANDEDGKR